MSSISTHKDRIVIRERHGHHKTPPTHPGPPASDSAPSATRSLRRRYSFPSSAARQTHSRPPRRPPGRYHAHSTALLSAAGKPSSRVRYADGHNAVFWKATAKTGDGGGWAVPIIHLTLFPKRVSLGGMFYRREKETFV